MEELPKVEASPKKENPKKYFRCGIDINGPTGKVRIQEDFVADSESKAEEKFRLWASAKNNLPSFKEQILNLKNIVTVDKINSSIYWQKKKLADNNKED
jgi:hypothetical protein